MTSLWSNEKENLERYQKQTEARFTKGEKKMTSLENNLQKC